MTPGGSSAGSGAAVAAGVGPFAIGSDGGGSIRIPAAHSGLVGIKASMGRVPLYPGTKDERYPGVSSWESLEHIGPLSRTVADSALMLSVISGPDSRDRYSLPRADFDWMKSLNGGIKGLRIAYSAIGDMRRSIRNARVVGEAVKAFSATRLRAEAVGSEDPYGAFWAIVAMETDLRGMRELSPSMAIK
jgi:aspartyl-tRNA(Asn)/glutamyl-tRNA(Gln) amidotransferase subunit A